MQGTPYNPVTPKIVAKLRHIAGDAFVLYGDRERLEPYSHDEVPDRRYAHMPEAVVRPENAGQIAAVLKLANEARFPVTPRGAGSGLSGGAVPIFGGVVLLMDRMNRILEVDRANLVVVVEPGVVTNEINELLKKDGLFFPGYPMSLESCSIGGNVAENAGGGKAVKYGVTSRYLIGLEVVTPTGEIVQLGGKRVKDVTGYDLIHLMAGSEGTLGVFTKIILKLLPAPTASMDLLCLFESVEAAINAVPRMMTFVAAMPAAVEFIDREAYAAACKYLNEPPPAENVQAMLLITVDGRDREGVEREFESAGEEMTKAGAVEVFVGDTRAASEKLWRVRRNIGEAFNQISHDQSNEDIVVPMGAIPELVMELKRMSARHGLLMPCFGHAADGNMHVRIVKTPSWSMEKWETLLPAVLTELYTLVNRLGGTISGEHGIGHKRKKYMPLVCSEAHLNLMRAIKKALDPNGVLNPGKVFDI
jgi:glycolate oxidase